MNEPTTLQDLRTGRMVDYSNASNLGTAIGIAELVSVNNTISEGDAFFKIIPTQGRELTRPDTNRFREYVFAETNNKYVFNLAVVPQKKGTYKMFVSNASNVIRTYDQCTKADFTINFKETNQHFYFNEVSFPGIILSGKNGVYLFKVK